MIVPKVIVDVPGRARDLVRNAMAAMTALILMAGFGCVSTSYDGTRYPETQSVELYTEFDQIETPYEIMGAAQSYGSSFVNYAQLEEALVRLAMSSGANAIVLDPLRIRVIGSQFARPGNDVPVPQYYRDEYGRLRRTAITYRRTEYERETQLVLEGSFVKYLEPTPEAETGTDLGDEIEADKPLSESPEEDSTGSSELPSGGE